MKKIISILLNVFFSFFKIQDKIVFESGRGLVDGNPRAIYEYMIKTNQKKFKLMWIVTKETDVSMLRKDEYVYYKTLKSYYHLATAKYWIRSQSLGSLLKKRKNQIYLQLWHGNGALKLMGYDSQNAKDRPPLDHVKEWDYYIANDELDADHIITSTGYNNKYEILGMACLDSTLELSKNKQFKNKVLKELEISNKNKKIILYAPTFRDFDFDKDVINIPIKKLSELNDYIVLVRLHPLVRNKVDKELFKYSNMINACNYPDVSDLLAISDILITDYSSIFYQFSPLDRPIIFYPYDYQKYIDLRGGFYLNYKKDLPGAICYNEEELFNTINNIEKTYKKYKDKQKQFNTKYNYLADGNASKRLVDKLLNKEFE